MRKYCIFVWFLFSIGFLVFHFGPGQEQVLKDKAFVHIYQAQNAMKNKHWNKAYKEYGKVLEILKQKDKHMHYQIRIMRAQIRLELEELPEALEDLERLLEELREQSFPYLREQTRFLIGFAEYYCAWIMRLEGAPLEDWKWEIDRSRQMFRLLAENSKTQTRLYSENLEAAIRLARMDLKELRGLPLPRKSKSSVSSKRSKAKKQRKKRQQGKQGKKGKKKDARGRSEGQRPDDSGS